MSAPISLPTNFQPLEAAIIREKAAELARTIFARHGGDHLAQVQMSLWLSSASALVDQRIQHLGPVAYRNAVLALLAQGAWAEWRRLHDAATPQHGGLH